MGNSLVVKLLTLTQASVVRIHVSQPILAIALLFASPSYATSGAEFLNQTTDQQTAFVKGVMDQYVYDLRSTPDQKEAALKVANCLYNVQLSAGALIEGTKKILSDDPTKLTTSASQSIVGFANLACRDW